VTSRPDFAIKPTLAGEGVVLRPFSEADLPAIRAVLLDPEARVLTGPSGRGRGLGTEATRLIVGYGFERLGLHRISLEVYAFNPRARRAYEKAGFRAECVLRESLRYNGEWIDATVMSVLAPEWGHPAPAQR
jgi:GNAT superfamily N-acetyltransferase